MRASALEYRPIKEQKKIITEVSHRHPHVNKKQSTLDDLLEKAGTKVAFTVLQTRKDRENLECTTAPLLRSYPPSWNAFFSFLSFVYIYL